MRQNWTKIEDQLLKDNWNKISMEELQLLLKRRTESSIRCRITKLRKLGWVFHDRPTQK